MSNAGVPEEGSIPNAVIIPTTSGPISILHLIRVLDPPVGLPCTAQVGTSTARADIAKSYDRFVRRPTGLVHRLFGEADPKPYVLFLSANINSGESWQLPVMLAHALEHAGKPIVQEPSAAQRLIWATGTVSAVDYAIGGVGHVSEKLRLSKGLLEEALGVGKVEIFVPAEDCAAIEPDVAEGLSALGLQISFVRTLDECLAALGLRTIPKAASRPSAAESRWKGNPYRGLKAFLPEHRRIFFGRARAREEALARLQKARARRLPFLLVTGRSGVGKSSFVQAGLLGDLIEQFPGEVVFRDAIIRPSFGGVRPAAALLTALESFANDETSISGDAGEREAAVLLRSLQERADQGRRYALVIDQLEELFAEEVEPKQVAEFEDVLDATVRSNAVWTIATLRADALGLLDRCPKLARLSEDREYRLREPSVFELSEIIAGPAAAAGRAFEDRTVPQELAEVAAKSPDSLPVLQAVLYELFDNAPRDGGLSIRDLDRLGGFAGAVANWAEASRERILVSGVSEDAFAQQLAALVRIEPETKVALTRTIPYADSDPKIVDGLIADRLLTADDSEGGPRIHLAHEILTTRWPYLAGIVGRLGEAIATRDDLDARAAAWEQGGRRPEDLVRGARLETASAFLADHLLPASQAVEAYVEASTAQTLEEEARTARLAAIELEQAQTLAASSEYALKQQRRWTRAAAGAAIVLAGFVAVIASLYSNEEKQKGAAVKEGTKARQMTALAQEKEAEAISLLIDNAITAKDANDQAVLAALSTISRDMVNYADAGETAAARNLIYSIYKAAAFIRTSPVTTEIKGPGGGAFIGGATFSKDSKLVAIPSSTSQLLLVDAESGLLQVGIPLDNREASQIVFDRNLNRVAYINFNDAFISDFYTREKIKLCTPKAEINNIERPCKAIEQLIQLSFMSHYVVSHRDGTIGLFDGQSGKLLDHTEHPLITSTDAIYTTDDADNLIAYRAVDDIDAYRRSSSKLTEKHSNIMRLITWNFDKITSRDIKIDAPLSQKARIVARSADTVTIYEEPAIYTASINTGNIKSKSEGNLVSILWGRSAVFSPKVDKGDAEAKDVLDIYSSKKTVRVQSNWKSCNLKKPYAVVSERRVYLYDHGGGICLYDFKTNHIEGVFQNPRGEIFELSVSPDDERLVLTSGDNTISVWQIQNMMASRPHEHLKSEDNWQWARAIGDDNNKFEFSDERISFTKPISVTLNTKGFVNYAIGLKERTVYGQNGYGVEGHSNYFFSIRFAQDGTQSLVEQNLSEDADAVVLEGGLSAFVQQKDCVAIWKRRESNWERGRCLVGVEDAVQIRPISGGSLVGGVTRDRRLLVWEPEKTLDARVVDIRVELQGSSGRRSDDEFWDMLSSTSDDKYLAVGHFDGQLRIADWRANQLVAGANLNLTCDRTFGATTVEGAKTCLKSVRFDNDAVLLAVAASTLERDRPLKVRELAWVPDPAVWRATKRRILTFAATLAVLGEGAAEPEGSSDRWCGALTADEPTETVDIKSTFLVRAILRARHASKDENLLCSYSERSRWPSSIQSVVSALRERTTERIVKIGAKDNLGAYGVGSSLVFGLQGKRSIYMGASILKIASEKGFRPGLFVGELVQSSSTCGFRNYVERDPIAAGLIAQSTIGRSGLLRTVELPVFVEEGKAEFLSQGEAQSPDIALNSAAFAVSELKAFKDDSFVQRVRSFGLAAAKLVDIQNPAASSVECLERHPIQ